METATFLSDRIFSIMDYSKEGLMNFRRYLALLDILVNGTQDEKTYISFKMIAQADKEFISFTSF